MAEGARQVCVALSPLVHSRCLDAPVHLCLRFFRSWSGCSAFIWHRDSTRVPLTATDSAVSASTPRTLTQGRLHLAHFIREIVFKLGLGSKYGA